MHDTVIATWYRRHTFALWASACYLAAGLLWIGLSDSLLGALIAPSEQLSGLQTFMGVLFVALSSIAMFALLAAQPRPVAPLAGDAPAWRHGVAMGRWSIGAQLGALVAGVAIPLALALALDVYLDLRTGGDRAAGRAYQLAQITVADTRDFLGETTGMLGKLAKRPQLRHADGSRCDPVFRDFIELHPRYANLVQRNLDGRLLCTSMPVRSADSNYLDPVYYLDALKRDLKPVIGKPRMGSIIGRWVVSIAYPVFREDGRLVASLSVSVDLARFKPIVSTSTMPAGSIIAIIDSEGTVIARSTDAEERVGRDGRDSEIVPIVLSRHEGTARSAGYEGFERIYGFAPIAEAGWYAVAGIPTSVLLSEALAGAVRNALLLMALIILTTALAVVSGRRITRPIRDIAAVAAAVGAGDTGVRVVPGGSIELTEVATRFNVMLDTLMEERLKLAASEERYRVLLELLPDGIFLTQGGRIVFVNAAGMRLVRTTDAGQVLGKALSDIVLPDPPGDARLRVGGLLESASPRPPVEVMLTALDGSTVEAEAATVRVQVAARSSEITVVRDISERKRAHEELHNVNEQLHRLSAEMLRTQDAERRALARELHDRVGQNLAALKLSLQMLESRLGIAAPGAGHAGAGHAGAALADAYQLIDSLVAQVRDVMTELRPPLLDEYGLLAALRGHAQRLAERVDLPVEVHGDEAAPRPPLAAESAMYAVALEALNNAIKHAGARHIVVSLEYRDGAWHLGVADDGAGFNAIEASRATGRKTWGLLTMRERIEGVGGRLRIASAPGRGTRVEFDLPDRPAN